MKTANVLVLDTYDKEGLLTLSQIFNLFQPETVRAVLSFLQKVREGHYGADWQREVHQLPVRENLFRLVLCDLLKHNRPFPEIYWGKETQIGTLWERIRQEDPDFLEKNQFLQSDKYREEIRDLIPPRSELNERKYLALVQEIVIPFLKENPQDIDAFLEANYTIDSLDIVDWINGWFSEERQWNRPDFEEVVAILQKIVTLCKKNRDYLSDTGYLLLNNTLVSVLPQFDRDSPEYERLETVKQQIQALLPDSLYDHPKLQSH